MWKRFVRAMKAMFGGAIAAIEDPKLILEQNIRDMQDQVPKMNQNIATVKAAVNLLDKQLTKDRQAMDELVAKVRAAINQGRDDIAANYAIQLERLKASIAQAEPQLAQAERAYEKALEVKKVFMKETERKIREANEALRAHERSEMQAKIADALEQFEVGGIDQTHNEMLNKINEKTAKNEAKVDLALESVDTTTIKVEEEAQKLRAMDLVNQYKIDMGIGGAKNAPASAEQTDVKNKDSIL